MESIRNLAEKSCSIAESFLNQLQYLYGLQYSPLKELKIFHASNNEIVKIEHLEKLRQLRELDLSKNRIR